MHSMNTTAVTPLDDNLPSDMIRLGFGCGGLLHGLSRSESLYLLETAIDCGITYFDTARMYGFGGAEGVLGTLVPRRREQIIIASKAGILPPSRSIALKIANRGIKLLHKAVPQLKRLVSTPTALHPRVGIFDLPILRKSVETSLRQLRTDYLDILLLHECTEADVEKEELLYFLQGLQKQGKIRKFGIATGIEETIKIVKAHPLLTDVVQIANSIWNMNIARLPFRAGRVMITHSTLTSRFHDLTRRISSDDSLAKQWQSALQIDPRDKAALARLLLAHALYSNPDGLVLFFSRNPENIRANASVASEKTINEDQIKGLNVLISNKELTLPLEGVHRDHLSVS
jgi:D-threo-aldose 1-dehydrogenase